MNIHPSAIVEEGALIEEGTVIGPFSVIGAQVKIGRNCIIHSHVTIDGNTTIGSNNEIFPYACIGKKTQDLKFISGNPGVKIGNNNSIREYATIHCATDDGDYTTIKDNCLILTYCHIAHDCILEDNVILSGGSMLAGHVEIGKNVIVSGMTGVIQFVKIGDYAFVGGYSKLTQDVPPYCIADGIPARIAMINKIGLERNQFSKESIKEIYRAFKCVFKSDESMDDIMDNLAAMDNTHAKKMFDFIKSSKKGVLRK